MMEMVVNPISTNLL